MYNLLNISIDSELHLNNDIFVNNKCTHIHNRIFSKTISIYLYNY